MSKEYASMPSNNYQLGKRFFIFSAANEIALRHGATISARRKIEPKAMEVLLQLVKGNGRVVGREELIDRVWDNYGGGEEALIQAVSKLRKAFGDDARSPGVIETIPKKGYRLLLPVRDAGKINEVEGWEKNQEKYRRRSAPQPAYALEQVGLFTGFIERLTRPRFLLAFLLCSGVVIMFLGALSYLIFWFGVMIGAI